MIPVIIPTYRGEKRLPRVLECLNYQELPNGYRASVYVRDNNVNGIYYTRAINEGLRKFGFIGGVEYCLALCDDVYLKPGCLASLIKTARDNPKAGIISPVQYAPDGKIVWAGSAWSWPVGAHIVEKQNDKPYRTYWASGAVFLVKTELLKEIGLMDENMLFICSDSDYSFTARSRGWQCVVDPNAGVEHSFGGSKATTDLELTRIKTRDLLYFSRKWASSPLFKTLEYKPEARLHRKNIERQERAWEGYLENDVSK